MNMRVALTIMAVLHSTHLTASAQTVFGSYDCGQWVNRIKGDPMENWLSGYLSGLNVAHTKGGIVPSDPLSELNSMDQARIWMDNYCRADPLSKISGAAVQLFSELIAKRRQ